MSEKKRRDQFNSLVNELCSMVRCDGDETQPLEPTHTMAETTGGQRSKCSEASARAAAAALSKKMDKSTILRSTIDFLKLYYESKKASAEQQAAAAASSTKSCPDVEEEDVSEISDCWKPSFLSFEEFAYLMLDVSSLYIFIFESR